MSTQGFPARIIHFEPAFDVLVIALLHRRADKAGGSR